MNNLYKRIFIVGGIFIIVFILFLIGSQDRNSNGIGTSQEYTPTDGPALMNNSEELYRVINDDRKFSLLREDLAFFGRNTIKEYYSGEINAVVFEVYSEVQKDDRGIFFEGKFDSSDDLIKVSLLSSQNESRTEIFNKENGSNIDSELPSNNPYNLFISSLPVSTEDYKIEHNKSTDSYTITGLSPAPNIRKMATDYIAEKTEKRQTELKILYIPFLY